MRGHDVADGRMAVAGRLALIVAATAGVAAPAGSETFRATATGRGASLRCRGTAARAYEEGEMRGDR